MMKENASIHNSDDYMSTVYDNALESTDLPSVQENPASLELASAANIDQLVDNLLTSEREFLVVLIASGLAHRHHLYADDYLYEQFCKINPRLTANGEHHGNLKLYFNRRLSHLEHLLYQWPWTVTNKDSLFQAIQQPTVWQELLAWRPGESIAAETRAVLDQAVTQHRSQGTIDEFYISLDVDKKQRAFYRNQHLRATDHLINTQVDGPETFEHFAKLPEDMRRVFMNNLNPTELKIAAEKAKLNPDEVVDVTTLDPEWPAQIDQLIETLNVIRADNGLPLRAIDHRMFHFYTSSGWDKLHAGMPEQNENTYFSESGQYIEIRINPHRYNKAELYYQIIRALVKPMGYTAYMVDANNEYNQPVGYVYRQGVDLITPPKANTQLRRGGNLSGRVQSRQGHFIQIQEALTANLTQEVMAFELQTNPFLTSVRQTDQQLRDQLANNPDPEVAEKLAMASVLIPVEKKGHQKIRYLGASDHQKERETLARFNELLSQAAGDPQINTDRITQMWNYAMISGNYLPIARTTEKAFGAGTFRSLASASLKTESFTNFVGKLRVRHERAQQQLLAKKQAEAAASVFEADSELPPVVQIESLASGSDQEEAMSPVAPEILVPENPEGQFREPTPETLSSLQLQLTEDNVNEYPQLVMEQFLELLEAKKQEYLDLFPQSAEIDSQSLEDAVCEYFGIPDVATTLAKVEALQEKAHQVDYILDVATVADRVLVETDEDPRVNNLRSGGTSAKAFEKAEITRRTKLVGLLLAEHFGVEITNADSLQVLKSPLEIHSLREAPYYLIQVHGLPLVPGSNDRGDRLVLICNQKGNATYVFNSLILDQMQLAATDFARLSKNELNTCIEQFPRLGRRVIDRQDHYTGYMIDALTFPHTDAKTEQTHSADSLLLDPAPAGYVTRTAIAKAAGISYDTVVKLLDSFDIPHQVYHFNHGDTFGYPPEVIAQISSLSHDDVQMRLEGSTLQLAGWASAHKIARDYLQADPQAVRVLIDKLQTDGVIGSGKKVMFHNGQPVLAFPPADIETIMTAFRQKIPERTQIPDGYLRLSQLEPHLAINLNSLRQLSHLLVSQGEMPPATVYRYARAYSSAYSPEQISVIEQAVNRLPRQQKTLAKLLGCQFSDIGRVIMDLIHDGQLIQKVFYDTHDQKLIIDAYCTRMGDSYRTDLYQQPKLTGYLEFLAQNG